MKHPRCPHRNAFSFGGHGLDLVTLFMGAKMGDWRVKVEDNHGSMSFFSGEDSTPVEAFVYGMRVAGHPLTGSYNIMLPEDWTSAEEPSCLCVAPDTASEDTWLVTIEEIP